MTPMTVPIWGLAALSVYMWIPYWVDRLLFKEQSDYSIRDYLSELSGYAYWVGVGVLFASLGADLYLPGWDFHLLIGAGSACPLAIWLLITLYLQLRPDPANDEGQNQADEQAHDYPCPAN